MNANSADYNRDVARRCTNAVFKSRRRRHFGPARGTHAPIRYYYYYYYYYHHRRRIPHRQPLVRLSAFPATLHLSYPELDHRVGRHDYIIISRPTAGTAKYISEIRASKRSEYFTNRTYVSVMLTLY